MHTPGDPAELLAEEREYLGTAVPKRVSEFAAGRLCARRALAELHVNDFPLRVARDRQPVWPVTIVGSITHTDGFCAAVVAEKRMQLGVGIDTEGVGRVTHDIWDSICTPAELAWVAALPAPQRHAAVTLIFSAKEAFYKCQYPVVGEWLDFHDVRVEVPQWGLSPSFVICAERPLAIAGRTQVPWSGNYLFHDGFVTAGIAFPGGR